MKDIAVGFLWHMHQPYYKDPVTNSYHMPWVRLHAVRGYYDMIAFLKGFPEVKGTFNLVPSLLSQLLDYTEGGLRDNDFYLSAKAPSDLLQDEKKQIVDRFFMCSHDTMIAPFRRYINLLSKKGTSDLENAVKRFSDQDILDLQVLFNLTWIGFMGRKDEGIGELIKKGRGYTEADKLYVLDTHISIMKDIIPLYQAAQESGQIEIATSPFYHPIGPLVMNVGYALRCMDTRLPEEGFSYPEDLNDQVIRAMKLHEKIFGVKPAGIWPAEGSVCPEMVEILAKNGLQWTATDEDILFCSLRESRTGSRLYRPYRVVYGEASIDMFFRDRAMADLIGFVYAKNPPQQAAGDFLSHLTNIRKGSKAYDFAPFVSIVLDGENPWEYYLDGGEGFLRGLYQGLTTTEGIKTSTFAAFLASHPTDERISNLYTGSWINHNFAIWIGHEEDRKAWEYLAKTRKYVASKGSDAKSLAWEEIYIAEGSDWFWWYGDDFTSVNDEDFDRLFRMHLRNCYEIHKDTPPPYLSQSILTPQDITPLKAPVGFIHPIIDGKISHFYEWRKAGFYIAKAASSSMYRHIKFIVHVYYGFDMESLYMRMDFSSIPDKAVIRVNFTSPESMRLSIPIMEKRMKLYRDEGGHLMTVGELHEVAYDSILEFKVPFAMLGAAPTQRLRFYITLLNEGLELERHPSSGLLALDVPEKGFERMMWYV